MKRATRFYGGVFDVNKPSFDVGMFEEFIRLNADDIWLKQEGYFEILHEREMERNKAAGDVIGDDDHDDPF